MTYSIIGRDARNGQIGCAVQSKFPGVGGIVLHGRARIGCLTTQAFADPAHGEDGLALLQHGATPEEALAILVRGDADRGQRQLAALRREGEPAAFTGDLVKGWEGVAASRTGNDCVATGNALSGEAVLPAMTAAFQNTSGDLADRLVQALRAGRDAGGELRGQQSAALLVFGEEGGYAGPSGRLVDISVYDHAEPIEELARCLRLHRLSYFPSRDDDLLAIDGDLAKELRELLCARGYAPLGQGATWEASDIAALKRFMGMENYDNRLRDDARIDREVLDDIRKRRSQATGH